MIIHYEIPDEEFSIFLAAENNAIISLNLTYLALKFGCDVPKAFEKLEQMPLDDLNELISKRQNSLVDFYEYLLKLEKEMTQ